MSEDGDSSNFFPITDISANDMEKYGPKLKCVDFDANYKLLGNFNTEIASNLMVVFERCDYKAP